MVVVDIFFIASVVVNKFGNLLSDVVFIFFRAILLLFRTQLIRAITEAALGVSFIFICTSAF
jgi:hypothetical protein